MIELIRKLLGKGSKTDFRQLCANGAVIIDVRMPNEFRTGHIKGAINVPLPGLDREIARLRKLDKPVITCCLSGTRSMMARRILQQQGIEAYNGGAWQSLQAKIR
jgi:rhodanese-related sulfurtransferase